MRDPAFQRPMPRRLYLQMPRIPTGTTRSFQPQPAHRLMKPTYWLPADSFANLPGRMTALAPAARCPWRRYSWSMIARLDHFLFECVLNKSHEEVRQVQLMQVALSTAEADGMSCVHQSKHAVRCATIKQEVASARQVATRRA